MNGFFCWHSEVEPVGLAIGTGWSPLAVCQTHSIMLQEKYVTVLQPNTTCHLASNSRALNGSLNSFSDADHVLFSLFLLVNIIFSPFPFFTLNFLRVLPYENSSRGLAIYNNPLRVWPPLQILDAREIRKMFLLSEPIVLSQIKCRACSVSKPNG